MDVEADEQVRIDELLAAWMGDYLAREHPDMPRPGTVCPFVKPALEARSIRIRGIPTAHGCPHELALDAARRGLTSFARGEEGTGAGMLRSLVLAFPDLVGRGEVIDAVHAVVKDEAVRSGLMIGQFHEACEEPSARNPDFPVNRAPLPLLVIRSMTVHDILFLHGDRRWFGIYAERFGHLFADGHRVEPAFRELYDGARSRFSAPAMPMP